MSVPERRIARNADVRLDVVGLLSRRWAVNAVIPSSRKLSVQTTTEGWSCKRSCATGNQACMGPSADKLHSMLSARYACHACRKQAAWTVPARVCDSAACAFHSSKASWGTWQVLHDTAASSASARAVDADRRHKHADCFSSIVCRSSSMEQQFDRHC